jgi:hypothetical protein
MTLKNCHSSAFSSSVGGNSDSRLLTVGLSLLAIFLTPVRSSAIYRMFFLVANR